MTYFDKEMEKLEEEQRKLRELQEKGVWDKYNSVDKMVDENDYKKVVNSDVEFSPSKGESWSSYYAKVQVYVRLGAKKNIKAHINGPKGPWWTHRNPQGCFCCEDLALLQVLQDVLGIMVNQYPDNKF